MDFDRPFCSAARDFTRTRRTPGFALLSWLGVIAFLAGSARAGEFDQFYAGAFAPGQPDSAGARILRLESGESAAGVDIQLVPVGGGVAGRIFGASEPEPVLLPRVVVEARSGTFLARTRSLADGTFLFPALPSGPVELFVATNDATSSAREFEALTAGPFQVSEGEVLELDDMSILLDEGAILEGRVVRDDDGSPEDAVRVEAVAADGAIHASHPPDLSGRFALGGLRPGEFTIRVVPEAGSALLPEVLGGARDLAGASFVTVEPAQSLDVGDLALDRGAEVGGLITRGSGPFEGAVVELRPRDGGMSHFVITGPFGFYTFVGIPAGTYVVYVPDFFRYYPDETREEDARSLVLEEGSIFSRIDVEGTTQDGCQLPLGSQGAITGFVDQDLSLVESAVIRAVSAADTLELELETEGFYTLGCVPTGEFLVGLFLDGPYLPQYHGKVEDPALANLAIVDADTTSGVDFEPVRGIEVSGTVTSRDGVRIPGARVVLFDGESGPVASSVSDELGEYRIDRVADRTGVPAGRYYVRVDSILVSGPDVTPVRLPQLRAWPGVGAIDLTVELPFPPWGVRLERADDPAAFSREAGVLIFESRPGGGVVEATLPVEDRPPTPGPWWYRLEVELEDGVFESVVGPVTYTVQSARGSLAIGPSPWWGTGSVRVFLQSGGIRPESADPGSGSAGVGGRLSLFDARGRRIVEIPTESAPNAESSAASQAVFGPIEWTPRDRAGRSLASGVYYLRWLDSMGHERASTRWVVLR